MNDHVRSVYPKDKEYYHYKDETPTQYYIRRIRISDDEVPGLIKDFETDKIIGNRQYMEKYNIE